MSVPRRDETAQWVRDLPSKGGPPVTRETVDRALDAWNLICAVTVNRMPTPDVCTGPDGQIRYSWDMGRDHLEVDFIPGKPAEWVYRDSVTGCSWRENREIADWSPGEIRGAMSAFYWSEDERSMPRRPF